jgi:2'-5' RNA ligase
MMGERLFAAVVPPSDVVDELSRWVDPRRDDAWRWLDSSGWHVTLAFYEDVEPWRYEVLVERLAAAATRTGAFSLSLRSVGCFSSVDKAHVLFAATDDPTSTLPELAERCHHAATTSGIEVARRKFHPHLTLARRNRPSDGSRYVRALGEMGTAPWTVGEVVLVRSFLGEGPGGTPRYVVRERLRLG